MRRFTVTAALLLSAIAATALVAASSLYDAAHWPQWRGPFHNGMARGGAPVEFGDNKNVKWKVAIEGRGFSTPAVWGDRIYLTTAVPTGKVAPAEPVPAGPAGGAPGSGQGRPGGGGGPGGGAGAGEEHKFVVMCLDRKTGKTIWERTAKVAVPHEGYHRTYGSFASNSPLTDGKYLYVSFGSRGIFCYDLDGKLIWEKDLGVKMRMRLQFGEGTAPVLHGNLLIHNFDQESGSFIVALDKNNGKEVWRVSRDEVSSWSTPAIIDHKGNKQLIVSASNKTRAYAPETGKLIWECAGLGTNVIPQPVQQGDLVLVMSGHRDPKLMAIRLGREGDLTGTDAVVWSQTRGTSYTASPVLHDNKLYVLTDNAVLSCFNATTGEPYYQQKRLPQADSFKASPVGADGKLYLASESGFVTVIKMGEEFEVLANNVMEDQMFVSSPVVVEGELLLRSKTHLFCISDKK
ncbi:MAG: PQQ-binding-like beta-propeller repeat protein [Acidobacteria bacterium]|nr:PQQ-binding-like beta-propeller repeat protein [Acidobacteriota bacterium]MCW5970328.1 PQQ-binding-like beta-propeller repeat protein [Blastocatellales bacterium]